jgi:histidyl-tRNA synthetase
LSRAEKIKAPRGTFDVLAEQAGVRASLEASARKILEGAGYERIETPTLEATELFARGVGASTDVVQKEMFTLKDGGGRSLTLRPEGTAPVCRAYVEHGMHKRKQPVKLWYLSSFFRHERAQAGRYRQFWQVGAEALGSEDPAVDAESIALLAALLQELGVRDVRLRLSSLGSGESRGEYRERLKAHLHEHEASLSEEVRSRIELNPLRAFDSEHEGTRRVMEGAPRLLDHLSVQDREHFAEVRGLLDAAEVGYEIDPTLVRGLDYYTRTVFEFTSDALGAQSGVGGGGRYDGLVEMIKGPPTPGPPNPGVLIESPLTPGMGWAAGVERILLAGEVPPIAASPLDLFVALGDEPRAEGNRGENDFDDVLTHARAGRGAVRRAAFEVLGDARSAGLTAQMELAGRSLKGQLGYANALGARYVAIVADGETVLKDMEDGGQETIATDTVIHAVLRGLRTL